MSKEPNRMEEQIYKIPSRKGLFVGTLLLDLMLSAPELLMFGSVSLNAEALSWGSPTHPYASRLKEWKLRTLGKYKIRVFGASFPWKRRNVTFFPSFVIQGINFHDSNCNVLICKTIPRNSILFDMNHEMHPMRIWEGKKLTSELNDIPFSHNNYTRCNIVIRYWKLICSIKEMAYHHVTDFL